jgi:glutathione peroxidase-family protein
VELPRLQPLYEKYKDKGFEIVAVEATRATQPAQKFIADNKLTYTFIENNAGDPNVVRNTFGVNVFPTSFLITRDGRVIRGHIGFEEGDEAKLEKELLELF